MKINIAKLEANGYIVDQDKKGGIIRIYPANGNTNLFEALTRIMDDFDVFNGGHKAEKMVLEITDEKIMKLCSDF